MNNLSLERTRFVELRRRLLELHPDLDDQTLADTLEGATDFREALAALIRSALEDECLAKALRDRLDQMKSRLSRLEARASSKRQVAVENMEAAELRKLQEPDFTASVRTGPPAVAILAEDELPIDYLLPQPPKPDRRAILEALSGGVFVPGAVLSEPKISLSVRSH
jgi:hypothetical protein